MGTGLGQCCPWPTHAPVLTPLQHRFIFPIRTSALSIPLPYTVLLILLVSQTYWEKASGHLPLFRPAKMYLVASGLFYNKTIHKIQTCFYVVFELIWSSIVFEVPNTSFSLVDKSTFSSAWFALLSLKA